MALKHPLEHAANKPAFSIIVLLSGKGSNLKAIIEAVEQKQLAVCIKAVISDKESALGLATAKNHHIPSFFIDPKAFGNRQDFDIALKNKIENIQCDLIVLAGFMRILSKDFVEHFTGKLINVHPSLLPKFKGLNTHQRAIESKEKIHGCSVHYVSPELDGGPVIAQRHVIISQSDTAESLQTKIHQLEHQLYPQVIQWIVEKKVSLVQGQLTITSPLET